MSIVITAFSRAIGRLDRGTVRALCNPAFLGAARSRMTKSIDKSVMRSEIGLTILPNVAMQADKVVR